MKYPLYVLKRCPEGTAVLSAETKTDEETDNSHAQGEEAAAELSSSLAAAFGGFGVFDGLRVGRSVEDPHPKKKAAEAQARYAFHAPSRHVTILSCEVRNRFSTVAR